MTKSKTYQRPFVESKKLSIDEIDLGIKKLKRRISDVKSLDPTTTTECDAVVDNVEHSIVETIREIFGSNSPEFNKYQYHEIWCGPHQIGMDDHECQQYFTAGIPQTVTMLEGLVDRLEEKREDFSELSTSATKLGLNISDLHLGISSKCCDLFNQKHYSEAVEKSFKVVRDRLRQLTGYETGSDAFGKGRLYIKGAAAQNVDKDFNEGVKFLTMAIDKFRNEKSHTSNAMIDNPIRAHEYLRLSSLAMNLLDDAEVMLR